MLPRRNRHSANSLIPERIVALAAVLAAGMLLSANAATIRYVDSADGANVISITGEIQRGDANQFSQLVSTLTGPTAIVLDSPGGLEIDGLNIGITIRQLGYQTVVDENTVCTSVCGLIWLAGSSRVLTPSSKIGFHTAYNSDGQESGQGNALLGAYLTRLGFSNDAVIYLTQATPDDMQWLNPADAARVGITYSLINPPTSKSEPRPFIVQPAQQQHPQASASAGSPAEQQARHLVLAYYAYWSLGGTGVDGLAANYADMVTFYNGTVPREAVMVEKRKFSARWPIRHYTVDPSSLFVQCNGVTCSVSGVVAWDCTNPEREAHSVGAANFALRIVNGAIVSENGSVLNSHTDTPESLQAVTTPGYAQGRQARLDYEQWYNGLAAGDYRDGATFWATHRGDKPAPPHCLGTANWIAGCLAARARLTMIDFNRSTDKNFWFGWNSL